VARLEPQKNPLGLVEAFSRVPGSPQLILAGEGSLRETVLERAGRCGVAARVHIAGAVADIPALMAAADVFALASDWEGSPLAVMEAMAAGLPVAATAVGGVPELVEHGVTGLLVPPGDAAKLAGALGALTRDAALRSRLAGAARARAARFGVDAMADAYGALFERLQEERR
jgi:2-deoxystreptamine N-acetyl-D-glucosaminyltransferase/2-deoxystreptamine glucosyltransferase